MVYDHWLGGPLSRLTVGGVFFAFLKVGLSVGVAMIRVYIGLYGLKPAAPAKSPVVNVGVAMIRVYIIGLWSILRRCLLSPARRCCLPAAAACPLACPLTCPGPPG